MRIIFGLLVTTLLSLEAFAGPVPFEKMQEFHDKRVEILLSNYAVEDELEISVMISPINLNDSKKGIEDTRIRLPGLLLGGIESLDSGQTFGIFEIIRSLKDYKRDITIVKKRNISDEELDAVKAGLKEYLAMRDDESIVVQDKLFNLGNAMKDWRGDLQKSIYTSFFKAKFWAWIPVALLMLFAFSTFFASAFKNAFQDLGKSIEKSAGLETSGMDVDETSNSFDDIVDKDFSDVIETEIDQVFEVDPLSILEKVFYLHENAKFELFNILWSFMPSAEKQISFYEVMSAEADALQAQSFKDIFFETFKLTPASISNMNGGEFLTGQELSKLHKTLVCAQLIDADEVREKALSVVYPKHGGAIDKIIESSMEQFFSVIYYLFPDKVLELLAKNPELSKKVSSKIAVYLSKPERDKMPGDIEIKGFETFLNEGGFLKAEGSIVVDENTMKLLYNIPDSAIFDSEHWDEDYKNHIMSLVPNVNWLSTDNPMLLKKFFLSISEIETFYVKEEHPDFDSLFNVLDERGQLRVQEKFNRGERSNKVVNIPMLRAKIKKMFKPVGLSAATENTDKDLSYAA